MEEKAIEILKIFNENGYAAYIVGGYVRDKLLQRNTQKIKDSVIMHWYLHQTRQSWNLFEKL